VVKAYEEFFTGELALAMAQEPNTELQEKYDFAKAQEKSRLYADEHLIKMKNDPIKLEEFLGTLHHNIIPHPTSTHFAEYVKQVKKALEIE
jgi:hypothetical protein